MSVRAAVCLLAIICIAGPARATTLDDFEKAAAVPEKFLDLGCVVYDRMERARECPEQAATELPRRDYPTSDLEALAKHRDPRVRALALVSLAAKEDPTLLPLIFTLTGDQAPTFPAHTPVAYIAPPPRAFSAIPKTPQTVGAIAEGVLNFYLIRAGHNYGSSGRWCPGFADYWEARKGRANLASWFVVQLDRATQGTSPIPDDRGNAFAALRARLEALSGDDRLWYSLFVGASEGGERIFSEVEMLDFGRSLGPDRLMLMLFNQAPASDPDLVPKPWPSGCGSSEVGEGMRAFVLEHAPALLRPDDASRLLESPKAKYATWAIGAASLRPDHAEGVLKTAIANLPSNPFVWDQARMAAALPRIAGPMHNAYALDWFYSQVPVQTNANVQEVFIREVAERSGSAGRALLVQLVMDTRFETISEPALKTLLLYINRRLPAPLVKNPYGYVTADQKKTTFAEWRQAIRASAPRWK